ncbi:methionine--tRNA ligase [bacterium]|nr:methionine--tRNA ligase [bacterium]
MKYLVTSALPYANGPIHLGHIAGAYLPADIYVRFLRNSGEEALFICGTDEHGVPITLNAESQGINPEDVIKENHRVIQEGFDKIDINFDIFSGTHNDTHAAMSQHFFTKLSENGFIHEKEIEQLYCEHDKMFLPDRYVEGICPLCGYDGARGDQCDKCGNALNTLDLKEPKCKICSATPIVRTSKHWFLALDKLQSRLEEWLESKKGWKSNVKAFVKQWFERGLEPRGITRDLSWGVPVPVEGADGKVLYVWFDAPIGYLSFTKMLLDEQGKQWEEWWKGGDDVSLVHFIGKDNIVFHAIIWPAMLMGVDEGLKLPDEIPANEFLNLEGDKISTSRNYAIWVHEFLESFDSDIVRFYLARIAPETKDADFSFDGFKTSVNSELSATYGNFVNRNLAFINKFFDGELTGEFEDDKADDELWTSVNSEIDIILESYKTFNVRDALFHTMEIGRIANKYFDTMAPWALRKENKARCRQVLLNCVNLIDTIAVLMDPITPKSTAKVMAMLGQNGEISFADVKTRRIGENFKIAADVEILFHQIDQDSIDAEKKKLDN